MLIFCIFQVPGSGNASRKDQNKEKRKRRHRKRKKNVSNIKGDAAESTENDKMEVVESTSRPHNVENNPQNEETFNSGDQMDAKMVQAYTQTRKQKGKNRSTQTQFIDQKNQETQTDIPIPKQDNTSNEQTQPGTVNAAEAQPKHHISAAEPEQQDSNADRAILGQNNNPEKDEATPESGKETNKEKECREVTPSAGVSGDASASQAEKDVKPKSYAKAVESSAPASKTADKKSQSTRYDYVMKSSVKHLRYKPDD